MKKTHLFPIQTLLFLCSLLIAMSSCQKMERPPMHIIPDDSARINGPLQIYLPFEDELMDSAQYNEASPSGTINYIDGIRGRAYQGAADTHIQYPLPPVLAEASSFTVSFWIHTEKHSGGAQAIFTLPNADDFWGNLFATIEGNDSESDNSMLFKFNFAGNWVEFAGNNGLDRLPDMYSKWRHLAFSYDENTSKFSAYLDGEKLSLPATVTNRTKDGEPLGPLKFTSPSRFVIGGYQQHIGISGSADSWMLKYTGVLDQFRLYITALSDAEIQEIFNNKQ